MKVLLCGEGPHDIGEVQVWSQSLDSCVDYEGWLQVIVRQLLASDTAFWVRRRNELVLLPRQQRKYQPLPDGHGAKALVAKLVADSEGCELVVFMADADSADTREWKLKRKQIQLGFAALENNVRGVACVPKSASESWLLADAAAWRGLGLRNAASLPARPEEIWGHRNDPNGGHPHQWFKRSCDEVNATDDRETRVQIANTSSPPVLRKRCPTSFAAFSDDLSNAAAKP
jgi:hypothetical protein